MQIGIGLGLTVPRLGGLLPLSAYSNANPLYIAHRSGSFIHPESTIEGYDAILAAGMPVVDLDVQSLADGALAVMHDGTVDRTTTGTGDVSSFTTAQWQALNIDSDDVLGGGFGNTLHPPLYADIIARYKGRALLIPEAKTGNTGVVDALVAANVPKQTVLVCQFGLSVPTYAVQAGYYGMLITTTTTDIAAAQAAGIQWVALDHTVADSIFQAWQAAGLKIAAWTVNRRYQRDRALRLGAAAIVSDDPLYMRTNAPIETTDKFASQRWMSGMLSRFSLYTEADRGRFFAPDYWGWTTNSGTAFVLQGWACPIKSNPNADSFTIDFKVTYDSAQGGDNTRFASIFVCNTKDYPFSDSGTVSADEVGYQILLRKSGLMQIYKRTDTVASTLLANSTGTQPAIADGEEVRFRVTVTPASITIARLDSNNVAQASATTTDTTYRGGYFWLGKNALACRFRHITIA